jgi:hypothetical protein
MDDSHGVALAFSLVLFWLAGVAFFVAFHPGGVKNSDGTAAQNPADIVKWLLMKGDAGASTQQGATLAAATSTAPVTLA